MTTGNGGTYDTGTGTYTPPGSSSPTSTTTTDGDGNSTTSWTNSDGTSTSVTMDQYGRATSEVTYNPDGTKSTETFFNSDGTAASKAIYNKDETVQFAVFYDKNGNITTISSYMYMDGSMQVFSTYEDGTYSKTIRTIDENGQMKEQTFFYSNEGKLLGYRTGEPKLTGDGRIYYEFRYYNANHGLIGTESTSPYNNSEILSNWTAKKTFSQIVRLEILRANMLYSKQLPALLIGRELPAMLTKLRYLNSFLPGPWFIVVNAFFFPAECE